MKLFLATLCLCTGCVVKERVKVERIEVPAKVIEKIYLIPAVPIQTETEEPEQKKPDMAA